MPPGRWYAPAGVLFIATAVVLAIDQLGAGGSGDTDSEWFGPLRVGVTGLMFLGLGITAAWPKENPDAEDLDVGAEQGWLDLYASHDLVPNGPLFHGSRPSDQELPLTSQRVSNLASPLRDHSRYWQNTDEFVATVAATLAEACGRSIETHDSWDPSIRQVAAARRRWRVGWLRSLRALAIAAAGVRCWSMPAGCTRAGGRR